MTTIPYCRPGGNPGLVAAEIRVYGETADGPLIIQVPAGQLTTQYVEQAQTAGATRIRIHALDAQGRTIDRVVVR